jgi:chromosome segregation ATPase
MKIALISTCIFNAVASTADKSTAAANPIRKVVSLLQSLQKKVEEEGERDLALFNKYMCYCKNSDGALEESIAAATTKVPEVGSSISEAEEKNLQLKAEVAKAQTDRDSAKKAIQEATGIREKTAAAFAAEKETADSNLKALTQAISAIEAGMAGSFFANSSSIDVEKNYGF